MIRPQMRSRPIAWLWIAWILLAIWIVSRPPEALLRQSILIDDTFYSLSAARHLAAGDGSTVDGVHRSNGYQPLWVWILAGVTKVGALGASGTARAAVFLCALATAGAGILAARLTRALGGSQGAAAWVTALWLLNPYLLRRQFNGLESALAAFLLLAAACTIVTHNRPRREARAGILAGLAGLARLDLLILLPLMALQHLWRAALLGAAIAVPWLVWSKLEFGSWVPLSGEATRVWYEITRGGQRLGPLLLDLDHVSFTAASAAGLEWPAKALQRLGLATAWVWLLLPTGAGIAVLLAMPAEGALRRLSAWWSAVRPLAHLLCGVLAFQWISFAFLYPAPWHLNRYFLPIQALLIVATGLFYDRVVAGRAGAAVSATSARRRWALVLWWALWSAGLPASAYPYIRDTTGGLPPSLLLDAARWFREEVPGQMRVATLQSGVTGYFSARPVINLDGKVNPGAMAALREGRMADYLCDERIEIFGDWGDLVEMGIFRRAGRADFRRRVVRLEGGGAPGPPMAFYRIVGDGSPASPCASASEPVHVGEQIARPTPHLR